MEYEGCSAGFATDAVFVPPSPQPICEVGIGGYIAWWVILALCKTVSGIGTCYDWYLRYIRKNARPKPSSRGSSKRRQPLVPALLLIQACLYIGMAAATSAGTCTSNSGCPLAIFGLIITVFGAYGVMLLRQFIRLGQKMIPLAKSKLRPTPSKVNITSTDDSMSHDQYSREDLPLWLIIVSRVVLVTLHLIICLPVQLSRSRDEYALWLTVAFALNAADIAMSWAGYIVQLQRLLHATKVGCARPYASDVLRAMMKMRKTQLGYSLFHLAAMTIYLILATGAVRPTWFIVLILASFETLSTTATFAWFVVQRLRKKNSKEKKIQITGTLMSRGADSSKVETLTLGSSLLAVDNPEYERASRQGGDN